MNSRTAPNSAAWTPKPCLLAVFPWPLQTGCIAHGQRDLQPLLLSEEMYMIFENLLRLLSLLKDLSTPATVRLDKILGTGVRFEVYQTLT